MYRLLLVFLPAIIFPGLVALFCNQFSTSDTVPPAFDAAPDLIPSFSLYYNPDKCGAQGYIDNVIVMNVGNADAGAFKVVINGIEQPEIEGLAAGDSIAFPLTDNSFDVRVQVDVENAVQEYDERNNDAMWSSMTSVYLIPCTPVTKGDTP